MQIIFLGSINDSFNIEKGEDSLNENIYKIKCFDLSKRTTNVFKAENMSIVLDLIKLDREKVLNLPNLGKTSFNEIQKKILKPFNLYFSYRFNENLDKSEIQEKSNKISKKYINNIKLENP